MDREKDFIEANCCEIGSFPGIVGFLIADNPASCCGGSFSGDGSMYAIK